MVANFPRAYNGGMSTGYLALSEKEKQTLRLLGSGYDAKSMARHLGLSVHTVNERLRDARRKMATSSSREAARQLRELEAQTPELLGDNSLGDAARSAAVATLRQQPESAGTLRRSGWIFGGVIMTFALSLAALTAFTGGAETPVTAPAASAAETAVAGAGRQWMALLDAGDWGQSYQVTRKEFRSVNRLEKWVEVSRQVRTPLGAMRSRALVAVDYAPTPQGYWIIKFRTDYANKPGVIETLSLVNEDGRWKVAGIVID